MFIENYFLFQNLTPSLLLLTIHKLPSKPVSTVFNLKSFALFFGHFLFVPRSYYYHYLLFFFQNILDNKYYLSGSF